MIPHKTTRGQQALRRMKAYEDIPARYTSQKTMVVPLAMRMLSLQRGRKYCDVGRLSHEVGWKYQHVVKDYEARRLEREAKRAKRLKIRHVSNTFKDICHLYIYVKHLSECYAPHFLTFLKRCIIKCICHSVLLASGISQMSLNK